MKTRACVLHGKGDVRIETRKTGDVGPKQVRVRTGAGGLCGSDIHNFWDGGIGTIQVSEPIILGHEVAGTVEAVGGDVTNVKPGDRVALCPSLPCGHCRLCQIGQQQHCLEMQFFGSAMRKPHGDGGFRDEIIIEDFQCEPVGDVVLDEAACAEPLSVGLHAIDNAGSVFGKRVLVMGAGPIGALLIGAAKLAGAQEIVAVNLRRRTSGSRTGSPCSIPATRAISTQASNALESASRLGTCSQSSSRGGTIVAVGVSSGAHIPFNALVGKEIRLVGTHRFHAEYATAAVDRRAPHRRATDHHRDAVYGPYSRRFRRRARSLIADDGATEFRDVERRKKTGGKMGTTTTMDSERVRLLSDEATERLLNKQGTVSSTQGGWMMIATILIEAWDLCNRLCADLH